MKCPFCGHTEDRVVDSRVGREGEFIRRRRECLKCHRRYTTYEYIEDVLPHVVKRDGRRERFDRQKLLRGLVRAASKRPVSDDQLEGLADSIAAELRGHGPEAGAEDIGELALRGLARLDPVTAIQFASVYRRFADLDELEAEVKRLKELPPVLSEAQTSIDLSPPGGDGESTQLRREHVRQP